MCGVSGIAGVAGGGAMTQMPPGKVDQHSGMPDMPPAKDATGVAGASGGGPSAMAGLDALRPALEAVAQALQGLIAAISGGISGGGAPGKLPTQGPIQGGGSLPMTASGASTRVVNGVLTPFDENGQEITRFQFVERTFSSASREAFIGALLGAIGADARVNGSFNPVDAEKLGQMGVTPAMFQQALAEAGVSL